MGLVFSVIGVLFLVFAQDARAACSDEPLWQARVARARTIAEELCSCDTASSTAAYVTCVEGSVGTSISQGLLPESCRVTVIDAAARSTCGLADSVACCTPAVGGVDTCAVVARTACISPSRIGVSESCYDACTSLPHCATVPSAQTQPAMDAALAHIKAVYPNVVRDENLFRLMYHQAAVEKACWQSHRMKNFYHPPGEGGLAPQSVPQSKPSGTSPPLSSLSGEGPCPDYDCLGTYQDSGTYCGPGDNNFFTTNCDDSCLNHACYRHDGCTREHCTSTTCLFATAGDCDECFHGQCSACLAAYDEYVEGEASRAVCVGAVCAIARTIASVAPDQLCNEDHDDCTCSGLDCANCSYCNGCPAGSGAGQCSPTSAVMDPLSKVMMSAKVTRNDFYCTQGPQAGCGEHLVHDCSASGRPGVRYYNCAGKWRDSCSGASDSNLVCDNPCGAGPCSESTIMNAAWDDLRSCAATKGYPLVEGTPALGTKIPFGGTEACCIPPP